MTLFSLPKLGEWWRPPTFLTPPCEGSRSASANRRKPRVSGANVILDDLIAANRAKPMIIVMAYGRPLPDVMLVPSAGRGPANADELFGNDLLQDVVPCLEKLYRVSAGAGPPSPASRWAAARRCGSAFRASTLSYIGAFSAPARGNPEEGVAIGVIIWRNSRRNLFR
jgi:hypothetical protein